MGQNISLIFEATFRNFAKYKNTMFWQVLGGILLIKCGITLTQFFWLIFRLYVLPSFGVKLCLKKYGSWAVITGATDGIGKAIAKQLAKQGLNIVLISRSEDKLKEVAHELESLNVQVKTISFDFSKTTGYENIKDELKTLEIGLLVNNVGMSYDHPDYYLSYTDEYFSTMLHLNITSTLQMTRLVLGGMASRKKGIVVNISSASALLPIPFLSVYSASKAFVDYFGQSVGAEYASQGIISQVVVPHFVATKLSKLRPSGVTVPSADAFAAQMVNAIGLSPVMAGYWSHEVIVFLQQLLPAFLVKQQTFNMMNAIRMKWMKKQQQKKE